VRPTIFWIVVGAACVLACGALAAPLVLSSVKIGAANTSIVHCDTDGFTHGYSTSRGNVSAVTVGGIADPACEGGNVRVTVTDSSGAALTSAGPQVVPTDGDTVENSVTLTTSTHPTASQVAGIHIVIEGP
jgi:hypothetical protein